MAHDCLDGTNTLISTTKSGEMAIWDLEKQKLISLEQNAHGGPIVSAQFLFNEPILVTSGYAFFCPMVEIMYI